MSDGFPLRCVGLIDDFLIEMSVTKIEKIRGEGAAPSSTHKRK